MKQSNGTASGKTKTTYQLTKILEDETDEDVHSLKHTRIHTSYIDENIGRVDRRRTDTAHRQHNRDIRIQA